MKTWLKVSISLTILFFIFYKINLKEALVITTNANPFFLLIAILVYILTLIIDSYALYILIKKHKKVNIKKLTTYNIYCWSIGMMLPGRMGDLVIIPFLKKKGITIGEGLAAVITNRLISVILTLIIAFLGTYIFFGIKTLIALSIIATIGLLTLSLISSKKVRIFIRKHILRSYEQYFKGFYKSLRGYFKEEPQILLLNILITTTKILIGGFVPFMLFKALRININFFILLIIFNTVTLLSFVPFTLSGLGLKESAVWFLLNQIGVTSEIIGSVILLNLVITYALGFLFSILLKVET